LTILKDRIKEIVFNPSSNVAVALLDVLKHGVLVWVVFAAALMIPIQQ